MNGVGQLAFVDPEVAGRAEVAEKRMRPPSEYRWAQQPPWRTKTWRCPVCSTHCDQWSGPHPPGRGPRAVRRCDECRVQWRMKLRRKRYPMRWKHEGCREIGWRRSLRGLVKK